MATPSRAWPWRWALRVPRPSSRSVDACEHVTTLLPSLPPPAGCIVHRRVPQVLLRKCVGEEQTGGASVLLSCVGLCGACLQSWLCGLLCLTGVEDWPATQDAAWGELCLAGLLSLCEPPPSTQVHLQADAMLPCQVPCHFLITASRQIIAQLDIHIWPKIYGPANQSEEFPV